MEHMKNDNDTPKFIGEIVKFISHFKGSEDTFLHGCCYWFAWILTDMITRKTYTDKDWYFYLPYIMYEPVEGHFVCGICPDIMAHGGDRSKWFYFDIRGNVTDMYRDKELYTLGYLYDNEYNWYTHLMRDCRDFLPTND